MKRSCENVAGLRAGQAAPPAPPRRPLFLMMLPALFAAALWGQANLATNWVNGLPAAIVLHGSTGMPVTGALPAEPGETLILQGSGFSGGAQILVGGAAVDTIVIDDGDAQFALPAGAGGSFLEIAVIGGDGGQSPAAVVPVDAPFDAVQLAAADVQTLVSNATMASAAAGLAVAVVDRAGDILAIYRRAATTDSDVEKALSLARTDAFFSSQATPLSSRTVQAISQPNFPMGIPNQPSGPLFGIGNTNRGCNFNVTFLPGQMLPQLQNATGTGYGLGMATAPGGLPLFRSGTTVVGGIGVAGAGSDDAGEYIAAASAQASGFFVQLPLPDPGAVYINGIRLPFINSTAPTPKPFTIPNGAYQVGPLNGMPAPEGWLVGPSASATLSVADVTAIVQSAIDTASLTRAAIRLPVGTRASMVISVADLDGNILALYRMPDALIFSIDVALTKARNVVYFSGPNRDPRDLPGVPLETAVTNRTVGFGSQPYFPSGIWNTQPGPFAAMYAADTANPCTQGNQPANPNQSGIVFFPGSAPLYRNGQLVGGLGVSGDGVDQDDFVTSGGAVNFLAPAGIRADQLFIRGIRLPYWSFPRNPEQ
jgi:uncharacterized protein GlcG (DUF336 family)